MSKPRRYMIVFICIGISGLIWAGQASGQGMDSFSSSIDYFQNVTSAQWKSQAFMLGRMLFAVMATIQVAVMGAKVMWGGADISTVLMKEGLLIVVAGAMLVSFNFFEDFVWGFQQAAATISGVGLKFNEAIVMAQGKEFFNGLASQSWANLSIWSLLTDGVNETAMLIITIISAFMVYFGFFIIALQYTYITVRVTLTLALGPFLIGFLPWKAFRPIGEGYIEHCAYLGVYLLVFFTTFAFGYAVLKNGIDNLGGRPQEYMIQVRMIALLAILIVFALGRFPHQIADKLTQQFNFDLESIIPVGQKNV